MTQEQLNAIRERAEMAAKGPWYVYKDQAISEVTDDTVCEIWTGMYDAEFIAHSRQDVPDLLAEVERLQKQISELICAIYEHANDGTELMNLAEAMDND